MDAHAALKEQYHATLAMLRQAVEVCPDDLWLSGQHPRNYWRIAYHAAFYAHLYMGQNEAAFVPWDKHQEDATDLWEEPPVIAPYSRQEILGYIDHVRALVDPTVDALDLDTDDSGFHWYKNITKLSHEILSVRHVQGHVGQLSELLMLQGIDLDWVSRRPAAVAT